MGNAAQRLGPFCLERNDIETDKRSSEKMFSSHKDPYMFLVFSDADHIFANSGEFPLGDVSYLSLGLSGQLVDS